jgi:hypothetical protein
MYNRWMVLAAALGVLSLAAMQLSAAERQRGDAEKARERVRPAAPVNATIKAVDAKASTITVTTRTREGQAEKTYNVAKDAKVTVDGQAKTLADLAAGTQVTLTLSADKTKVSEIATQKRRMR